ncbi:MAG TPA: hypothetical protein VHZ78_15755 [Rhizomicrobium sp.]|jgi:hypothetical protein|nr:hypothetical protein [Rhizomicrobium sp.]
MSDPKATAIEAIRGAFLKRTGFQPPPLRTPEDVREALSAVSRTTAETAVPFLGALLVHALEKNDVDCTRDLVIVLDADMRRPDGALGASNDLVRRMKTREYSEFDEAQRNAVLLWLAYVRISVAQLADDRPLASALGFWSWLAASPEP